MAENFKQGDKSGMNPGTSKQDRNPSGTEMREEENKDRHSRKVDPAADSKTGQYATPGKQGQNQGQVDRQASGHGTDRGLSDRHDQGQNRQGGQEDSRKTPHPGQTLEKEVTGDEDAG